MALDLALDLAKMELGPELAIGPEIGGEQMISKTNYTDRVALSNCGWPWRWRWGWGWRWLEQAVDHKLEVNR